MRRFIKDAVYRKSILKLTIPLSILLGLAFSFGMVLEKDGKINFSDLSVYLIGGMYALAAMLFIIAIWVYLDSYTERSAKLKINFPSTKIHWVAIFLFLVICYTITFLAVFPGFFAYDATMAYLQVYRGELTSQHPWIHTLLLGYICEFAMSHLGHANVGIAIYIYAQMLFVACCFTYTLYSIKIRTKHNFILFFSFLFYALFPTIHMFVLCSTKDTIFTAVMLILIVFLINMFENAEQFFSSKINCTAFILFAFAFMILRKNAIYAMIAFTPFFLYFLKRHRRKGMFLLAIAFLLFCFYDIPLTKAVGIRNIGPQESLSVPSQQLARVYNEDIGLFTDEEIRSIESFYPKNSLENYLPKLADCTKGMLNREYFENHIGEYVKLWGSIGLKAPEIYLNSFLVNTYGFWYPFASLDGYKGYVGMNGTILENAEVFYFAYETEMPGERISLIPPLDSFYFWISTTNLHHKIPVLSLLFSPGFLFWVFIASGLYCIHQKRRQYYPAFILMFLLWLTVQLGPISLVRYVLFLFFALPIIISAVDTGEAATDEKK